MRLHIDVPITDAADWRALHTALDASPPNLQAAYPIIADAVNGAATTSEQKRRALAMITAALGPPD